MDSSPSPLDAEFSHRIAALLAPPPPESAKEYYDGLIDRTKCQGIQIKFNHEFGKGVFANTEFKEDELILKDLQLVAAQHSSNKLDCLVCSYCFCYIGSIELQIGRKLYLQGLGSSAKREGDYKTFVHTSKSDEGGSTELVGSVTDDIDDMGSCSSRNSKDTSLPEEVLKSLMNGDLSLPYTKQFALPPIVACPGGCKEEYYCSKLCADSDWESFHSLLCIGESLESSRRAALLKFIEHANGTNDIFILAAKVISFTLLRYKKLKRTCLEGSGQYIRLGGINESSSTLLLEAWKPILMGFKRRWWDSIALPDDVDICNEASFRMQIRDLALESLQLLKEAIFDKECAPLFSLEIYGHIIGMFELNNLDLVVSAPPVEDYFIYINDLPFPKKEEAEKRTRPFLDALGDEYSVYCQGTAFFPLQSCMNHSCRPNAKAFKREEDRDGQATIIALRSISIGEEITIAYIDEDLPYEERQAQLADYGFRCRCPKCREEQP